MCRLIPLSSEQKEPLQFFGVLLFVGRFAILGYMNNTKGFTLIELMVVAGVISMLASMNVASLSAVRGKVNDILRISDVRQLNRLLQTEDTSTGIPMALEGCDNANRAASLTTSCTGPGFVTQFKRFFDPAKLTSDAPCVKNSITTCGYSVAKRDGSRRATTNNYQLCFYLEQGGAGLKAGLNSMTDHGVFRAGCL